MHTGLAESLQELLRILRAAQFDAVVDAKVWHAGDALALSLIDFLLHFFCVLIRLQPLLDDAARQARLFSCFDQHSMVGDILLTFEIRSERSVDQLILLLFAVVLLLGKVQAFLPSDT